MNNKPRMDDVYLSALQNIGRQVKELNESVNKRLENLEKKLDLFLEAFDVCKNGERQFDRDENLEARLKTLQRYNVSSSGEYSSDSGVESKLNTELIEKHTDQQVSEAVQSNSSSEYTTPRDEVSPDVKHINIEHLEPTRMPYVAVPYSTDNDSDTEDDSLMHSIQETEQARTGSRTITQQAENEYGNFGMSISRTRSLSPLPSAPERIRVPCSKFKRLRTDTRDDNRATFFAEEIEIVPESNPASQQRSDEDSHHQNNRQLSETGLKNEHEDDNRFVREAHLANDDFLNRLKRKDWKRNQEIFKLREDGNRTIVKEPEQNDYSLEVNTVTKKQVKENQESPAKTTVIRTQQILSQQQQEAADNEDVKASDGLDTIICIDTSASMYRRPLKRAQELLLDFIDGLDNAAADYDLEENIAVVTFGKENKIVQHLTNDYDLAREAIENLDVGGPSPLWLGLALSLTEISARGSVLKLTNRQLPPRIILVTDGFATPMDDIEPTDSKEPNKQADETIASLIQMNNTVIDSVSPVIVSADFNKESLTKIANMTNGKLVLNPTQLEPLQEYFRMQRKLDEVITTYTSKNTTAKELLAEVKRETGLSDNSAIEIVELLKKETSVIKEPEGDSISESAGAEKLNFTLMPGWSRVRATPNWAGDESRLNLVGTVISTRRKGKVKVLWDDGFQETYKFGEEGIYEVHVVDENRYLEPNEDIAVGIHVVRGPDWRWQNQDGGRGSIGVVTKIDNGNVVHVVWPDGKLGNYRFGYSEKYDIQVCENQRKPKRHAVWQYNESVGGDWNIFPQDFMDEIETLYQTDPTGKSELVSVNTTYMLDLPSMKITDGTNTDLLFNIRRKEVTEEEKLALVKEQ